VVGVSADGWLHLWRNKGGQLARMQSSPASSSRLEGGARSRLDASRPRGGHLLPGRSLSSLCPSRLLIPAAPPSRPTLLSQEPGALGGTVGLVPPRAPPMVC
jgi:hypothetical protein